MKHILKKGIAILLAILCTLNLTVVSCAEETVTSGTCGANASWSFDEVTGTLTISGEGAIEKYIGWSGLGEKIKTLNIKDGITEIGYGAFSDCKSLTEVIIPDSVTVIEGFAFSGCTSLKDVYYTGEIEDWCAISIKSDTTLPASFNLYLNGILVEKLVIPDGVAEIGNYKFKGCKSITSVTIPDGVTKIGHSAFKYCDGLIKITIPESLTSVGSDAVQGSVNLNDVYYTGSIEDWCAITFKSSLLTNGSDFYLGGSLVESLEILDVIEEIGANTFAGCTSFTSVTIPESIKSIDDNAFKDNINLEKVYYTGNIADWFEIEIGQSANPMCNGADFYVDNTLVENIVISDAVTSIGNNALSGCKSVVDIVLPESVTNIGDCAFVNCTNLEKIYIPDSVKNIGGVAFSNCGKLSSVNLPYGITVIREYTFNNCASLTEITIPNSVKEIEYYAFRDCESLNRVTIPNSVTNIGAFTFNRCISLSDIKIPGSVIRIENNLFDGCTGLTEVSIGAGVTKIEDYAFRDCKNLSVITIPESITSVGYRSFKGCDNLTTVNYYGTKEQWKEIEIGVENLSFLGKTIYNYYEISGTCGENATWSFDEARGTLTISGTGAVTDYSGWKNFADKVTYVEIGNGITSVGENVFNGFTALKEVYMAESVSELGDNAFAGCSELAIVTALSDTLSFSNAFSGNDSRLFFVAKAGSEACNALKSAGYTVNGISTNREKDGHKVLAFDGKTTVYKNLDYNYISNLISDNMDAHYLYFDKVTFEGIAPDTIIIDEENIDSAEEYFTLNEVYISVSVNGKTVSLPELVDLLQNEDADGIISFEQKDAPTIFEIISSFFNEVFEDFVEEANRVIISVINAIKRLFRR